MLSLFSSVSSRGRSISTCVKGGITHCMIVNIDFELKLSLVTFVSTSTTAVDNSTICTNKHPFFLCGILSLFGVVV